MKTELLLSKLLPVLPPSVQETLAAEIPDNADLQVCRKAASADTEELQEGERAAIRYVSTRDKDRDDEIMLPSGAVLDQFRLAPQVLWGHNYSEPPIGSDEWIRADDYGLKAKTVYATTPRAEEVWTLVKEGHLKTSSVGFVPLESVRAEDSKWKPLVNRLGQKWGVDESHFSSVSRIHTKWLLLEHSDVSVPSNIHALTQAVAKGLVLNDEIQHELGLDAWPDQKPYPQEHACRIHQPGDFEENSFRRMKREHEGKEYSVIMGKLKGESTMTEQAYRYDKDTWTAGQAGAHCKAHDGSFEAASGERAICRPCHIRKIGQVIPYGIRPINIEEIVQEQLLYLRGKV
jgi:HK97 family phage prohead protease